VDRKETVRRFIEEAINGGRDELIDELCTTDMASQGRDWFGTFRRSFPDITMETVQLVAERDTVVGRFACSATHRGAWRGHPPTGRRFENVDEVYFFTFSGRAHRRRMGHRGHAWPLPTARPRPTQALTRSLTVRVARHRPRCCARD
jgi:predicted ester cyclase